MFVYAVIYVVLSILLGLIGYNRKFGFWGYFFGSMLLTPLVGILLVLASDPRKPYPEPKPDNQQQK